MKEVNRRNILYRTLLHDFENGFVYVENWANSSLNDCFFAYRSDVWPDGSIKKGKLKYFYSRESGEDIKKEVKPVRVEKFKWFDKLYFVNLSGDIQRIDGTPARDCDYGLDFIGEKG